MKRQRRQGFLWMAAMLLFTEAAHAEVWQRAVTPPDRDQIDRALRLGEQFQEQAPASREASIPLTFIPPAYLAPSRPAPRATYYYNPHYEYCRQYPWAYQCCRYPCRSHQPGYFQTRRWHRGDDRRHHEHDRDKKPGYGRH